MNGLCSDPELSELIEAIAGDDLHDVEKIDRMLGLYPEDARLHFMKGSALAAKQRAIEAHRSLQRAVELAPDFAIARYQLGFFELTSGEAEKALSTWGPLLMLPEENYLRRFVEGLTHLIRDEFDAAIARFEAGMAINRDNGPMNHDIALLVGQCRAMLTGASAGGTDDGGDSATSFLLGRFASGSTQH